MASENLSSMIFGSCCEHHILVYDPLGFTNWLQKRKDSKTLNAVEQCSAMVYGAIYGRRQQFAPFHCLGLEEGWLSAIAAFVGENQNPRGGCSSYGILFPSSMSLYGSHGISFIKREQDLVWYVF